jgi:hypothetical protein
MSTPQHTVEGLTVEAVFPESKKRLRQPSDLPPLFLFSFAVLISRMNPKRQVPGITYPPK